LEQVGQAVKFLKAVRRKGVKKTVTNESRGRGSGCTFRIITKC
jgi:hypothetical protein